MKKLLLASFASITIAATGLGVSSSVSTADAAETSTQQTTQANNDVYSEFIEAGGTKALWDNIVMPESSGDPEAVNELGYKGLGQTKETWGTGTVEEQTKGMINYAEDRYGSIEAAIDFRLANGWW
ncbi:aggregation-promoting factor C-terminal-like domain-containing protein [Staphylococcus parequorum]|uniref:aggregation-promoting factor C-terminal-like domain-containing protein n=1 Tax=Staphylococcus sp. S9 TaxID=3135640 RepID=UPI003CFD4CCC